MEQSRAQQAWGRRLAESRATIPCFEVGDEAAAGEPDARVAARVVVAVARALDAEPGLATRYADGGIEPAPRAGIGVLVDGADAPELPVLHGAAGAGVDVVGAQLERARERALAGDLTAPERSGAAISVVVVPATRFTAIPLPGHVAALGVGAREGRSTWSLTLSCDARAVGPATAARFLAHVREALEA